MWFFKHILFTSFPHSWQLAKVKLILVLSETHLLGRTSFLPFLYCLMSLNAVNCQMLLFVSSPLKLGRDGPSDDSDALENPDIWQNRVLNLVDVRIFDAPQWSSHPFRWGGQCQVFVILLTLIVIIILMAGTVHSDSGRGRAKNSRWSPWYYHSHYHLNTTVIVIIINTLIANISINIVGNIIIIIIIIAGIIIIKSLYM